MLDFDFNLEHNAAVELLQAAMKVQEMLPDIEHRLFLGQHFDWGAVGQAKFDLQEAWGILEKAIQNAKLVIDMPEEQAS